MNTGTAATPTEALGATLNRRCRRADSDTVLGSRLFIYLFLFISRSLLGEPKRRRLANNNSSYRDAPCGTIKISSESSICLQPCLLFAGPPGPRQFLCRNV